MSIKEDVKMTAHREPFDYAPAFYNEVIAHLEAKWQRQLTEHEKHVLIEGYRFGRLTEMYSFYSGESISEALRINGKEDE
jgi:hypothetical protein